MAGSTGMALNLLAKDPRFNALSGGATPQSYLSGGMMSGQLMKRILSARNRQVGAIAGVSDLDPISARLASAASRKGQVFSGAADMFMPMAKSQFAQQMAAMRDGMASGGGGSSSTFDKYATPGMQFVKENHGSALKGVKKLLKKIF